MATMFEENPSVMGSIPLFSKQSNTSSVIALWVAASLAYTLFVKYVVFGSLERFRPFAASFWMNETIMVNKCCPKRKARFFKCVKRNARRQSISSSTTTNKETTGTAWSCPFECAFAKIHMPAPLPFRRKKKKSKTQCPISVLPDSPVEPSTDALESERKKKKSHRGEAMELALPGDTLTACTSSSSRQSKRRHRHRDETSIVSSFTPALPVTATCLIDLALMQNWPQLLVNVKANRRGARQRDVDGLYPLHWAVSGGPPLEVVHTLLRAYPGATKKVDSEGSNTLHFASHYGGSAAMMKLIIKTYPKGVCVQDKYGRSPLYHAVDKAAGIDVLETLATADPSMITTSCRPKNYLQLEKEGKAWNLLTPLYLAWVNVLTDKRSVESHGGKVWEKACLLLQIAYHHRFVLGGEVEAPLAAAVVAFDSHLPKELASVVVESATPEELLAIDPVSGKNPLALAASLAHKSAERSDDLIRMLAEACPKAGSALDREGKTPLAIAAASGKTWDAGIERLFQVAPEALGQFDGSTGLPPFLLAAAASSSSCVSNEGATQEPLSENRSKALLADPYGLMAAKTMTLRQIALANTRRKKSRVPRRPSLATARAQEPATKQLSTIYQLLKEDPAFVTTAYYALP